jgi:arylsulfatase A-like enzyme
VPLVVAAPGRLPAGERVESPLALEEVYGGLLDLAGIGEGDGVAWREAVAGSPRTTPIQAKVWPIPYWSRNVGGAFEGPWQLYREGDEALVVRGDGSTALFDLAQDAGMQHDLGPERPERLAALVALAEEAFPEAPATVHSAVPLPEEMIERLRALGYVSE